MMRIAGLFFFGFLLIFQSPRIVAQISENDNFLKANTSFEKRDYKNALEIYNNLIEKNDKNPDYYLARAKCFSKMEKMQDAYNDYNMAVKLGNMNSIYYYERGLFLSFFPQFATEAIDNFTMAKNYALNDSMIYNSLYYRGSLRSGIRDYEGASVDFRNAYNINPHNVALLNNMALCYNDMGKGDSAIILIKRALEIDSASFICYENIGFIYSGLEKYKEALEYFDKSLSLMKQPSEYLYNNRGYVKFKLKDYQGALKDINKSLKINKNNAYAYRNRALVYIEMGNLDKACPDLEKALKLNYTLNYGDDVKELSIKYCK
jgi:tetratricopeptide (TPR) repeat protein